MVDHKFNKEDPNKQASPLNFQMVYSTLSQKDRKILIKYVKKDSYFKLGWKNSLGKSHYLHKYKELSDVVFGDQKDNSYPLWAPRFGAAEKNDNILKLVKANNYEIRVTLFLLSCRKSI